MAEVQNPARIFAELAREAGQPIREEIVMRLEAYCNEQVRVYDVATLRTLIEAFVLTKDDEEKEEWFNTERKLNRMALEEFLAWLEARPA